MRWCRSVADRTARRIEQLPHDGLVLRHRVHRVVKSAGVAVAEAERRAAYRASRHSIWIERHGVERRPRSLEQRSAEALPYPLGERRREPQWRTVAIVGEPGRKDGRALVRQVEPPARF